MHSLMATKILPNKTESIFMCCFPLKMLISSREAIAFAKTRAFGSFVTRASREETRLLVSESFGAI